MSSRSLRFSRWRRLPGVHRILDRRLPTHAESLHRFTVYLPGRVIEDAESLARLRGLPHAQAYCEAVLIERVGWDVEQTKAEVMPPEPPEAEDCEALAVEITACRPGAGVPLVVLDGSDPTDSPAMLPAPEPAPQAEAARGHEPADPEIGSRFLASLRGGRPPSDDDLDALVKRLADLARRLSGSSQVDRRLAHRLFRLGLESQVLVTDAWPELGEDPRLIRKIRLIQEWAERVLGGVEPRAGEESES
ncbi:MAG: hypothetical protein KatS3mg108_1828 [Isosphaeraceae bacterium]|nr:MAG: hypothetical protein KatS3mg108_1828 [Isosphaeraceae bacterium]